MAFDEALLDRVPYARARLEISRTLLTIVRLLHESWMEDRALDPELLLVAAAVYVGHAEDQPMTASQLAATTGIPRTTVLRKTSSLVSLGYVRRVGTAYVVREECLQRHMSHIVPITQALQKACGVLAKVDIPPVMDNSPALVTQLPEDADKIGTE